MASTPSSILINSDGLLMDMEDAFFDGTHQYLEARSSLRNWLFVQLAEEVGGRSIGDALAEFNRRTNIERTIGVVLIRCLNVEGLLPPPNSKNQIARLITEICEVCLPEVCKFLEINPKAQNHEKFAILSRGHQTIARLLEPISDEYGDLQALVNARKTILGALNHSIVKTHCGPFRLSEFRSATESLFSKIGRVITLEPSFLQDFEECQRSIEDFKRELWDQPTFLSHFFGAFLKTTVKLLEAFLYSVRAKYQAKIRQGWGAQIGLQKRYPLHESGREFHIVIPLRNEGTGLAMDVEVTAITSSDDVIVSNQSILLGSVKPGDFSVILDAMVATPTKAFRGLLEVTWGEIGNPERLHADFDFEINAQSSDVDWPSLEYWTPYSTSVAEGESFIGRADLVRSLAGKLLRTPMEPYRSGEGRLARYDGG